MADAVNMELIERGQASRVLRRLVEDDYLSMEEDIIDELCQRYLNDTLTNDRLRGMVGELSRVRKCRVLMEQAIQRGVIAAEKELGTDG